MSPRGRLAALRGPRSTGGRRTGCLHRRRRIHPPREDAALAADDAFATATGEELLTGLRGKDVLIVFVESYGRVAVEDPAISPEVNGVLTRGTESPSGGRLLLRPQRLLPRRRSPGSAGSPTARSSPACGSTVSSAT